MAAEKSHDVVTSGECKGIGVRGGSGKGRKGGRKVEVSKAQPDAG